ncbi:MAG: SCO family protein [bacterium]
MSKLFTVVALLTLGITLGTALAALSPAPTSSRPIEWLDSPRALGPFSLQADGGRLDNQTLKGRWHIVAFGFLNCVDVCPTNLAQLAELAEGLAQQSGDHNISFVFVSVDPGRDTVTAITQYVQHFSPAIRGATGTADQLVQFTTDLGIQLRVATEPDEYSVAHSSTFSIIDPEGVFRGRFRPGVDAAQLLRNLTTRLRETRVQAWPPNDTDRLGSLL